MQCFPFFLLLHTDCPITQVAFYRYSVGTARVSLVYFRLRFASYWLNRTIYNNKLKNNF